MSALAIAVSALLFASSLSGLTAQAKPRRSLADRLADAADAALVQAPQDQELCFSPEGHCDLKLLKFVETAAKSLDIAIYDINLDQLVHEIIVLSKKIPVRVVVDRKQAKGARSLVPVLIKGGVPVRYGSQRGIMHNKFTVVDGRMIETGSFNYTNHASRANNEHQIYLASPKVVAAFAQRFEHLWAQAAPAQ